MNPKLSILMPALASRRASREFGIEFDLLKQITVGDNVQFTCAGRGMPILPRSDQVELVIDEGPGTHGAKMGRLMAEAKGEYLCAVDDDDRVAGCYVAEILKALESKPDVATFNLLRVDLAEVWEFCSKYNDREWIEPFDQDYGTQMPILRMSANHLCVWRREIAQAVPWPDKNRGADVDWYTEVKRRFPNLREVHIPRCLYLYFFDPEKTATQKEGTGS